MQILFKNNSWRIWLISSWVLPSKSISRSLASWMRFLCLMRKQMKMDRIFNKINSIRLFLWFFSPFLLHMINSKLRMEEKKREFYFSICFKADFEVFIVGIVVSIRIKDWIKEDEQYLWRNENILKQEKGKKERVKVI